MNTRSKNLTEVFTTEGIETLKNRLKKDKNIVLTFKNKGKDHHYKIKVTDDNRVLGREITMGSPEGLKIVEDLKEQKDVK